MNKYFNVRSNQESVLGLECVKDTVYVRTNIERVETDGFNGWEYNEIQYTLLEYQELLGNQTQELKKRNSELELEMSRNSAELFETMVMFMGGM